VSETSFLTNHARVLACIARDPEVRLRDIATTVGMTERHAYGIVDDLTLGGYLVKEKEGRRNRYQVQFDAPLNEDLGRQQTVGDLLKLLVGPQKARKHPSKRP